MRAKISGNELANDYVTESEHLKSYMDDSWKKEKKFHSNIFGQNIVKFINQFRGYYFTEGNAPSNAQQCREELLRGVYRVRYKLVFQCNDAID